MAVIGRLLPLASDHCGLTHSQSTGEASSSPAAVLRARCLVLPPQLRVTIPNQGKPLASQHAQLDSAASCLDEAPSHNPSRHVRLTPPHVSRILYIHPVPR